MISIAERSLQFIKNHKKELLARFAGDDYPSLSSEKAPATIFMAGSPGAGKTEFSKGLLSEFKEQAVRIDADDIRTFIPEYNGKNSDLVQGAASVGVEKLFDYILTKRKNAIIDGTFMNKEKSMSNIERSLNKGRKVEIYYVFQEPCQAWEFTKAREKIEGRAVPQNSFVQAFLLARKNVNDAKLKFGHKINLNVVVKNFDANAHNIYLNVNSIDEVLKNKYDKIQLEKLLSSTI